MVMVLLGLVFVLIIMNYLCYEESFLYITQLDCCNALIGFNHLFPLIYKLNCGISIIVTLFMPCFMIGTQMLYINELMVSKT